MLLGSTLRWNVDALSRQLPVLPEGRGFPRKVKPLVRLTERETAAWCVVRGIDYQVEECPMAAGNRHLDFKATLNDLESRSPGAKAAFYLNFLENMAPLLAATRASVVDVAVEMRTLRVADHRRHLRLLPAGRGVICPRCCTRRDAAPGEGSPLNPLRAGERVILLDSKRRRYLVTLADGGEFHSHNGFVPHADIIGRPEGISVRSTRGSEYRVLRPTLEDVVVEMPRGAQVIYPKDLAPICMLADIGPGVRVFESGVGSGALSMTMLRWGASIVGYEMREDFANRARTNVREFLGDAALDNFRVELRDSYEGIDPADAGDGFDRVVLDLPEPWQVVPHAERALRPGGILVAYTPSITQAAQTREALKGKWIDARTIEVLHRGWHIEGQAVRPDHRMVAHTAFLSVARWLG